MLNRDKKDTVRAVDRAIEILFAFDVDNVELSLTQIMEATGLPKTTVFRILETLEANYLVVQDTATGKYRLGYEMIRMGGIAQHSNTVSRIAQAEMQEVSAETGQTCNLYVRDHEERLCIAQVMGDQYIHKHSYLGARHPLYCGAGKLLLAYESEAFLDNYLSHTEMKPFSEHTITDPETLRGELKEIRRKGYAVSRGERDPRTAMVAVPLFDFNGKVVASITVSGPVNDFTDSRVKIFLDCLQKAEKSISRKMGYRLA